MKHVGAIVLGRRTYEMFSGLLARRSIRADEPVAGFINTLPKHVVSNTLPGAPWGDHGRGDRRVGGRRRDRPAAA